MSITMAISGFLFLFIIITLIISDLLGHGVIDNLKSDIKLEKINGDPKKFKISFGLFIIEHVSIIFLAIMLFIAFSKYNIILGVIWLIFRTVEGLINIYSRKNYWELFNIAGQYLNASSAEKIKLVDIGYSILKTRNSNFTFAQILFSIGTLAYSILFVAYEAVPVIFGWFGIVASIIYGSGNGIKLIKPSNEVMWKFGAILVFFFELGLGGWLLLFS
ncbi:MAG: DUF4386 family protein [Candidatus Kariarchaeaceae archaeon]|jgi:hypothetical protein